MAIVRNYSDIEFLNDLNDILASKPDVSQRDIGETVGISVAVVNGLLKRCLQRGWIATQNLNLRKLKYIITPEGVAELTRRSFSFMKRNFAELSRYKKNIDAHIAQAKLAGKSRVVLYGESSVGFLIEESCLSHDLDFFKMASSEVPNSDEVPSEELAVVGENRKSDNDIVSDYFIGDSERLASVFALAR